MKSEKGHRFTGIIPARYASTRFPGKPLVMIGDRTMIHRVYDQAKLAVDTVYVATDDEKIFREVRDFGGNAVMTSPSHPSGTDRCEEAVRKIEAETGFATDIVINIQGDEPFIRPEQIALLMSCFDDANVEIATLIRKTSMGEDVLNPNHPKVVIDSEGNALYFSRSVIPYIRDCEQSQWSEKYSFFKHIGLYAYRTHTLNEITKLKKSVLESAESLEQNRWLENGFRIRTAITEWESLGIDTPADLEKAIKEMRIII